MKVMVKAEHHIVMRQVLSEGCRGLPRFAVTSLLGSIGLGCPAVEEAVPCHLDKKFFVSASWADPSELPIVLLDLAQWEAVSFRWRSPAWQHNEFPEVAWPTWAVRAFPGNGGDLHWRPLLEVVASEAFWRLGNDFVRKLGFADDVPPASRTGSDDAAEASSEFFQVCLASVRSILGTGERDAVSILKSRVIAMDSSDTYCWGQILEADGCMSVFDKGRGRAIQEAERAQPEQPGWLQTVPPRLTDGERQSDRRAGARQTGGQGVEGMSVEVPALPDGRRRDQPEGCCKHAVSWSVHLEGALERHLASPHGDLKQCIVLASASAGAPPASSRRGSLACSVGVGAGILQVVARAVCLETMVLFEGALEPAYIVRTWCAGEVAITLSKNSMA